VRHLPSPTMTVGKAAMVGQRDGLAAVEPDDQRRFHVNGSLLNFAAINGGASATAGITDFWSLIEVFLNPGPSRGRCRRYGVAVRQLSPCGRSYTSWNAPGNKPPRSNVLADGRGLRRTTRRRGVPQAQQRQYGYARGRPPFQGTLVIDGNVKLDEAHHADAVQGSGDRGDGTVSITNSARNVTINGAVIARRALWRPRLHEQFQHVINGTVISDWRGYDIGLNAIMS